MWWAPKRRSFAMFLALTLQCQHLSSSLIIIKPMKKFNTQITEIIVHCTATQPDSSINADQITCWHLRRGFETIGYHYVVKTDGTVEEGRRSDMMGAHCKGHNHCSIGVVYVGGIDRYGYPYDSRTQAQKTALRELLVELKQRYPQATIHGHYEFAAKSCPCFDVAKEYKDLSE